MSRSFCFSLVLAAAVKGTRAADLVSFPLIPHHVRYSNETIPVNRPTNYTRRLRGSSSVDALYQGYGTHYVDLWVGTPVAQRQTLIVDTGSAVTAFPCEGCRKSCGLQYHTDSYYKESKSQSFSVVDCKHCLVGKCGKHKHSGKVCAISVSYQEGSSWRAFEAQDLVYSGGSHISPQDSPRFYLHFGCQTHVSGYFKTQLADGIMGMEMASTSFWKQMYNQGALKKKQFSLCLSKQPTASREGTGAGAMTLGGTDKRLHNKPMVYAKQVHANGWFVVRIKHLYLKLGEKIVLVEEVTEDELNGRGSIILDSGTTDTYLPSRLSHAFTKAWKSLTKHPYDNASHKFTSEDELLETMPTLLFQLQAADEDNDVNGGVVGSTLDSNRPNDVLVAMPPTHYMEYVPKTQHYSSRVYFNENHGGVLGANFLMGHDVLFDAQGGRVGFAESNCDYSQLSNDDTE